MTEVQTRLIDQALLIRETEERLFALFGEGRLHGTIHSCAGQEFAAVGVSAHLRPEDHVFSNHRGHGHYLAFTQDLTGLIQELLGTAAGVCGGAGGSQHLRRNNFISNGVQGNLIPIAAGTAFDRKLEGRGIAVLWIGDGTLGQGVLWETLNLSALWRLPLLIALEDNGFAQSTRTQETFAGNLQKRVEGFGVTYAEAATADWSALHTTAGKAIDRLRAGEGPQFLHIQTSRLRPHSKGDDTRPKEEIAKLWDMDPLTQLIRSGKADASRAKALVDAAVGATSFRGAVTDPLLASRAERQWQPAPEMTTEYSGRELINQALHEIFTKDSQAIMIGQDVRDPYGGCFKVSAHLSEKFSDRILNCPISEAAMAGIGTGASLQGRFFLVEFMFGDFLMLAADQILNGAAKLAGLGEEAPPRVVYRTPMGGGKGYGPTHSQNLEKHFLGIPGLHVFALNEFVSPRNFYETLHETLDRPALVIEDKTLYGRPVQNPQAFPDWDFQLDSRTLDLKITPRGLQPKTVLIGYGSYCHELFAAARRLFAEYEIPVTCLFLTKLSSYTSRSDAALFANAEQVLIFEEGIGYAGLGAEIAADLGQWNCRVARWAAPEALIPAAPDLERKFRLSPEAVIAEVLETLE